MPTKVPEKSIRKTAPTIYDLKILTEDDFVKSFESVVSLVLKNQKQQNEALARLEQTYATLLERIKRDYDSGLLKLEESDDKRFKKMYEEHERMTQTIDKRLSQIENSKDVKIQAIDKRLSQIEDNKDADEKRVAQGILSQIKIPSVEEIEEKVEKNLPRLGVSVRDGLELLQDAERLDISAVKGVEELKIELEKIIGRTRVGGFGRAGGIGGPLKKITITGTVNGTNAEFTLDKDYLFVMIYWNGQLQEDATHYTRAGRTITFTAGNIPTAGTIHGVGQS